MFSKNGSIPQEETDGTDGWSVAPSPPECPEGKQLIWLNQEWIIRDFKPADREGYQWNWQHESKSWIESAWGNVETIFESLPSDITTSQITNLTTAQL